MTVGRRKTALAVKLHVIHHSTDMQTATVIISVTDAYSPLFILDGQFDGMAKPTTSLTLKGFEQLFPFRKQLLVVRWQPLIPVLGQ